MPSRTGVIGPKRLLAIRKQLGLSQEELAARLGVNRCHVRRVEHGRYRATPYYSGALLDLAKRA
jgi:transcriptional regulator with XRE-family HTH domain